MNFDILNCGRAVNGQFGGRFHDHMMASSAHLRLFFVLFIGAIFLVLFIKFLVAWLVYKDATAKNIENRKVWFFLVFVTSILGSLFYFLMVIYQHKHNSTANTTRTAPITPTQPQQQVPSNRICTNCGTSGDGKFCSICGQQF